MFSNEVLEIFDSDEFLFLAECFAKYILGHIE